MAEKRRAGRPEERAEDPPAKERIKLAASIMAEINTAIPPSQVKEANRRADKYIRDLQEKVRQASDPEFSEPLRDVSVFLMFLAFSMNWARMDRDLAALKVQLLEQQLASVTEKEMRPEDKLKALADLSVAFETADAAQELDTRILDALRGMLVDYMRPGKIKDSTNYATLIGSVLTHEQVLEILSTLGAPTPRETTASEN